LELTSNDFDGYFVPEIINIPFGVRADVYYKLNVLTTKSAPAHYNVIEGATSDAIS